MNGIFLVLEIYIFLNLILNSQLFANYRFLCEWKLVKKDALILLYQNNAVLLLSSDCEKSTVKTCVISEEKRNKNRTKKIYSLSLMSAAYIAYTYARLHYSIFFLHDTRLASVSWLCEPFFRRGLCIVRIVALPVCSYASFLVYLRLNKSALPYDTYALRVRVRARF